jgi:hypothetical protein
VSLLAIGWVRAREGVESSERVYEQTRWYINNREFVDIAGPARGQREGGGVGPLARPTTILGAQTEFFTNFSWGILL